MTAAQVFFDVECFFIRYSVDVASSVSRETFLHTLRLVVYTYIMRRSVLEGKLKEEKDRHQEALRSEDQAAASRIADRIAHIEEQLSREPKKNPKARKRNSTSKGSINRIEKTREIMAMRASGKGYAEIAAAFGYVNNSGPYLVVAKELDKWVKETHESTTQVVQLELDRLDQLLAGLWDSALGGDGRAIDRVLKIMDRRAKYLGLDAATKTELTGAGGGPVEIDVTKLTMEELEAIVRGPGNESKG